MDTDPLAGLRDVHAPPVPEGLSAWPLVAGLAGLLILVVLAAWMVLRLRRRWAREMVEALDYIDPASSAETLAEAAKLLRRAAVLNLGTTATRLRGDEWLATLDGLFRTRFFSSGAGRVFGTALYAREASAVPAGAVVAQLRQLARRREWTPW